MKKLVFGIDIGGTNTAFGLVDEVGEIFGESAISSKSYSHYDDYPRYIEDLAAAMKALVNSLEINFELVGIGVGAPNANYYKGTVEIPSNMWKYTDEQIAAGMKDEDRLFNFSEDLGKHFPGVPVYITNDANAATIGEMVYGGAKGMKNFIMVTLGTGVGSGFVANGEMIYGHDGFAGEFGHVIVERGGRECGCGRKGCLETYTSAGGIKRTAFELLATMNDPSPIREYSFDKLEAAMLSKFAKDGDPIAKECFRLTGQKLGYALADAVAITSPEAVFLFGGLAKAGDLIFEPIKHYMEETMLIAFKNKVKVLPSELQNKNAAVLGAAALVWQAKK
ncbi:MAG: ROK family protein [Alistipes sp.]|nr:ROK family protein [Alistipes sp.]